MRRAALARLLALGLIAAGLFVALAASGPLSVSRVRDFAGGGGLAAVLLFVLVSSLLTVALFPGPVLAATSGLLFGTALGTGCSIVAATCGALLAFTLARYVAGDTLLALAGPRVRRIDGWIGEHGFLSVLYARIAPGLPYTVVNYAAGLTPVRTASFALATTLGCAPRAFAYTALGGHLGLLTSTPAIAAIVVLVAMGVIGLWLGWREHRRAQRARTLYAR